MLKSPQTTTVAVVPYLEHYPEPGGAVQRIVVEAIPFRLGRGAAVHFIIPSRQVSKEHAEIYLVGDEYRIRDLNSTNGTFVNGQRVHEAALAHGDIVHVAHKEFRFAHETSANDTSLVNSYTEHAEKRVPASLIRAYGYLKEMLADFRCRVLFQPILSIDTHELLGYEALGRGTHAHLSTNPGELFRLAEQCGLAVDVSQMFRLVAVEAAACRAEGSYVFLNLHPQEMNLPGLFPALSELSERAGPGRRLVLEVHESAVADTASLRKLRDELKTLGMGLAYDDFGAGQARLTELVEVPPDFVKLDMSLVRGIHLDQGRQQLVRALGEVIRNLGVKIIAEGIEKPEEAKVCQQLGCHYCQGFLFGRPQPLPLHTPSGGSATWKSNDLAADLGTVLAARGASIVAKS